MAPLPNNPLFGGARGPLPDNPTLKAAPQYAHVTKTSPIPGANGRNIGTYSTHTGDIATRGALPANPLGSILAGATAKAPAAPNDLTGIATHIATNEKFSPAFLRSLQDAQAHDSTFQTRLNAEIDRVSQGINAKRNSGPLAFAGNAIEGAANPLEWAKGAIEGAPQVAHGVAKIAHGNVGGGAAEAGLGALGVAGVIPGVGRAAHLAGDALKVGRTAEEAGTHLSEVAAKAAAEGHAHVPLTVAKGAASEATGGELGRQIRESLVHAPAVRAAQKLGFSEERSDRFRAAMEAHQAAGGGMAGFTAGRGQLQGELGREFFGHLKHLTPEHVAELANAVDKAPLLYGQKLHVMDSIRNAVDHGIVPTEGDQALLHRVFGAVADNAPEQAKLSSFWDKFVSYTNIPRAVRSSADVSAGLRQGLVVLVTHPKVWGSAFTKSVKSFGSEDFYQAQKAAIENDPLYPLLTKWKVPFTDIGGKTIANTEEAFIGGQAAEHLHELPGIKGTPVATLLKPASNVIRRSDRAFTGFQNGARFELAKMLAEKASLLGHDLNDEHLGQSIAKVVGTFTGRGVTPKILEGHLTTLNAAMFSPRLMAARLNLMSPVYYAKLDPFARAEALKGARNLVASIGTVMFVAKTLGADVNLDPRSSNFAKIKIGNTRIDIAGGFSQYVRLIAQEMTREAISSAGHKSHIGWGSSDISDLANLTKLARSKAAPIPSLAWDEGSGKDFIGQPVKQGHEAWSNAPFVAQDTVDAFKQSGSKAAVVDAFLSSIGLGVQSYKDKPVGGGSGGSSDGFGGSGGGFGDNSGGFGNDSGGFSDGSGSFGP